MALRFGPDDETAFFKRKAELLEEVRDHLGGRDPDGGLTADVGLFLGWRWAYSTGELDRFDRADVEEFLLEWCPRKVARGPEDWVTAALAVGEWVRFLAATGRWRGGPPDRLIAAVDELIPEYLDAMADPSTFGMAKGMFMGPALAGPTLAADDEATLTAALAEAMEQFNALPDEERFALTDQYFGGGAVAEPEPIDLPLTPAPDPAAAVEQAAAAPILTQLEAVAAHLGPTGKALTATGNPKLVDARALAGIFATDDVIDREYGGREHKLRSADQLPHLQFLLAVARAAGAVEVRGSKVRAAEAFAAGDPLDRIRRVFDAMVAEGPILGRQITSYTDALDELMEDGLPHWVLPLLLEGEVEVDALVGECTVVVLESLLSHLPRWMAEDPEYLVDLVADRVEWGLDALERCGALIRSGDHLEEDRWGIRPRRRGGVATLTELGRELLPTLLAEAGLVVHTVVDLRDRPADEVVAELAGAQDVPPEPVWTGWLGEPPDRADPALVRARVQDVVDVLATTHSPADRLTALALLSAVPEVAADAVQPLRDGPLAAHVEMLLAERSGADAEGSPLAPDVALRPVVDLLSLELDAEPEFFVAAVDEALPGEMRVDLVGVLWAVDQPETIDVLDAIGRHHPDKTTAKTARKAAHRHRTTFPGR